MATRVRATNRTTVPTYARKSDYARALMAGTAVGPHSGIHDCAQTDSDTIPDHPATHKVAEVSRIVPKMGYSFAYGVAKRYGLAESAADRKETKRVQILGDVVKVRTSSGIVTVHADGKVTRSKN